MRRCCLQGDGSPWGDNPGAGYHREVKQIVSAIGADPDATMYALRHSSIVRMLMANVPIRLVASLHNTSVQDDREELFEVHYRALRRCLAPRTIAARVASRRECRRSRRVIKFTSR